MSTGLYQMNAVTQEQQALSDGALMADAAKGHELMRQLEFNRGYQTAGNGWTWVPGQSSDYNEGFSAWCLLHRGAK